MEVLNEYPSGDRFDGHHYLTEYLKEECFCPNCGQKGVWLEQGLGDYYLGSEYICVACAHSWTMQGPDPISRENELVILEQLRSGITKKPTTKRVR